MSAVEASLGEAYSEPAADVRGYIASVRQPVADRGAACHATTAAAGSREPSTFVGSSARSRVP